MPVTTTRLIDNSFFQSPEVLSPPARSPGGSCRCLAGFEQADAQVGRRIDHLAIGLERSIGDASLSRRRITRFKSTTYSTFLTVGSTIPVNFTSPTPSARPRPAPQPAQEKSSQLPQGIEPKTSRHHRIAFEMALEEPIEPLVPRDRQLGNDLPLPCAPPSSDMWGIWSNINIGGSGSCALPGPKSLPWPHDSRSLKS